MIVYDTYMAKQLSGPGGFHVNYLSVNHFNQSSVQSQKLLGNGDIAL